MSAPKVNSIKASTGLLLTAAAIGNEAGNYTANRLAAEKRRKDAAGSRTVRREDIKAAKRVALAAKARKDIQP